MASDALEASLCLLLRFDVRVGLEDSGRGCEALGAACFDRLGAMSGGRLTGVVDRYVGQRADRSRLQSNQ